jgi:hypothetical protein
VPPLPPNITARGWKPVAINRKTKKASGKAMAVMLQIKVARAYGTIERVRLFPELSRLGVFNSVIGIIICIYTSLSANRRTLLSRGRAS